MIGEYMYILEIINVNPTENKFFEDSDIYEQYKDFYTEYFGQFDKRYERDIYKKSLKINVSRDVLPDGGYRKILKKSFFKTQQAAENYLKESISEGVRWEWNSQDQERVWNSDTKFDGNLLRTRWIIENGIIFEHNILDAQGNFVKCMTSCARNICATFGTCTPENTCANLFDKKSSFVKRDVSLHHIPISSIIRK
jgi:hypothetical protein